MQQRLIYLGADEFLPIQLFVVWTRNMSIFIEHWTDLGHGRDDTRETDFKGEPGGLTWAQRDPSGYKRYA